MLFNVNLSLEYRPFILSLTARDKTRVSPNTRIEFDCKENVNTITCCLILRSRDRILLVVQRNAQDHINCNVGKYPFFSNTKIKMFTMNHNLEELFVMAMPIFVDLQGSIVGKRFVVKEVAILKKEIVLSHYIFASLMKSPYKIQKTVALHD